MTNWAQVERAGLVDDLDATGPDAPTLCAGWNGRDLAAHLILRERRPDAAVGIVAPPLAGYTERVQRRIGARPWPELLDEVRTGPPWWSPIRPVDAFANLIEYYVHHEDVRRAQPGWAPRELPARTEDALWRAVSRAGRGLLVRSKVGIVAERSDTGASAIWNTGPGTVVVRGLPSELVLYAFGRKEQAVVEKTGEPDDVAHVDDTPTLL
jgi:uncharacterized protein (TIGR03085 family)